MRSRWSLADGPAFRFKLFINLNYFGEIERNGEFYNFVVSKFGEFQILTKFKRDNLEIQLKPV